MLMDDLPALFRLAEHRRAPPGTGVLLTGKGRFPVEAVGAGRRRVAFGDLDQIVEPIGLVAKTLPGVLEGGADFRKSLVGPIRKSE